MLADDDESDSYKRTHIFDCTDEKRDDNSKTTNHIQAVGASGARRLCSYSCTHVVSCFHCLGLVYSRGHKCWDRLLFKIYNLYH